MGMYESFRRSSAGFGREKAGPAGNPLVQCEVQEPIERIAAAWAAVDRKAYDFLARFAEDTAFDGILDVDKEWTCWMKADKKNSCLFFDDTLEVFDNAAYDHFVSNYSKDWKELAKECEGIAKMGKSLDEYQILKTSLYNVFNNKNGLSVLDYYMQVGSRAEDYGMELERHSKEDMDYIVHFKPLKEINRGDSYLSFDIYMSYNPDHKKEGYVYTATMLEAHSADAMYSGPVELPVYGQYEKFEACVNSYFLSDEHSLFYYDALKARRVVEKEKYNIPADYFEGTFIDTKKLVDFSDKSYRYGDTRVFIPKSQVMLGGDKLYMKRWLFNKLKEEVMAVEKDAKGKQGGVDSVLEDATQRCCEGARGQSVGDRECMGK